MRRARASCACGWAVRATGRGKARRCWTTSACRVAVRRRCSICCGVGSTSFTLPHATRRLKDPGRPATVSTALANTGSSGVIPPCANGADNDRTRRRILTPAVDIILLASTDSLMLCCMLPLCQAAALTAGTIRSTYSFTLNSPLTFTIVARPATIACLANVVFNACVSGSYGVNDYLLLGFQRYPAYRSSVAILPCCRAVSPSQAFIDQDKIGR